MSKRSQGKIATDGGDPFGSNPFGALGSSGLSAGPSPEVLRAGSKVAVGRCKRGRVEVRREKAGRGGKTVTSLKAFAAQISQAELDALALELKKACACGGTCKGRDIELQGDVVRRVIAELQQRGFQPVQSGG